MKYLYWYSNGKEITHTTPNFKKNSIEKECENSDRVKIYKIHESL